jgi:predicted O-methyltransferase YrrM
LYSTVAEHEPSTVVEVGMAQGASTLAILAALDQLGGARTLISIDRRQSKGYDSVGLRHVERAGFGHLHELREAFDHVALPELLAAETVVDFAYIDGMHTFDNTLLGFFYLDKMMPVGAVVGFNDCALPAVDRAVRFVTRHRKYEEIDVGLRAQYASASVRTTLGRVIHRRSKSDRYFRKVENWTPKYNHWKRF